MLRRSPDEMANKLVVLLAHDFLGKTLLDVATSPVSFDRQQIALAIRRQHGGGEGLRMVRLDHAAAAGTADDVLEVGVGVGENKSGRAQAIAAKPWKGACRAW